jgi:hypothetical protein
MKRYFFLSAFVGFLIQSNAQNTFPSSGNVGIGTTSPVRALDVIGIVKTDGISLNASGSASAASLRLVDDGNGIFRPAANVFSIATAAIERLRVSNTGYLGLGESSPNALGHFSVNEPGVINILRLQNKHTVSGDGVGIAFNPSNNGDADLSRIWSSRDDIGFNLRFSVSGMEKLCFSSSGYTLFNNGNVGVGTDAPSEKLSVNGNVRAKKVIVTQNGWSDYVFNDDYKLKPLSEVEVFIKRNKHLPDIPSAKEVEEKGISVGDNQALLLKKIEELTLYVIELKKENQQHSQRIQKLEQKQTKTR